MSSIITSIHDPAALAFTCRQLHLPPPENGSLVLNDREVHGWIVVVPGVRHPIVCNLQTGLIAYHPADNGFSRYARIMRFIYRYYEERARLRRHRPVMARKSRSSNDCRRLAVVGH